MVHTLPVQVVNETAERRHRFQHYLWHRVRKSWPRLTKSEQQAVGKIDPQWIPPRPCVDATGSPLRDNDSGEDFLFMHRQMIAQVNAILAAVEDPGYTRVEGWSRIPPPGDADYPVPAFSGSGLEEIKSTKYFEEFITPWERRYTDPAYLRNVTLGQLGSDMEFTIHNDMHMRWAAPSPVGYRPTTAFTQNINAQWDAPAYNYLGDTYSSHVSPVFWKLHGWLDDRIEDWKRAHGVTGEIAWKGNWVGPAAHHHDDADAAPHAGLATPGARPARSALEDDVQRIDRIISASGASDLDGFFKPTPHSRP